MSDYWFPSVDGSGRVAAGAGRVVLRQPDGTEQVWSDVHRPCFLLRGALSLVANGTGSRPAGVYQCAPDGTVAPFHTSAGPVWGANDLAVGDGWVASANAGQRAIMVWPSGAIIDDAGSPSIWGSSLVCIKHPWDERRHLALNPPARGEADRPYLRLAEGDVRTPRLVEDLVAWCVGTTPWFRWPDGRIAAVGLGRAEYWPVPVRVDGVIYLMTHDHYGHLMLRLPGMTVGRVIHRGVTDYPAIAATGHEDEVHVAWSAKGVLGEWRGRLRDLPLVDLRFGPPAEPPVLPLDIWAWMTPSQDGLIVADAGGQTLQTWQTADDVIDQVKWGDPRALERWTRHDTEVRLAYDATDPKGVESPWRLVPNRWARRQVELGALDVYPDAVLIRRQRGTTTSERFPFAVGQLDYWPVLDLGGDLGWCAVRTLTFSPWWPSSGETEINWYAIRLSDGTRFGRVRFQLVKDGRTVVDSLLNRVLPGPGVRPDPPLPIPDPPEAPVTEVTISEPGTWPQTVQVNQPLRCVARIVRATPHSLRWQWRYAESGLWQSVTNPAWDDDHTFRFSFPGPVWIRLQALDLHGQVVAQTGMERLVTVTDPDTPGRRMTYDELVHDFGPKLVAHVGAKLSDACHQLWGVLIEEKTVATVSEETGLPDEWPVRGWRSPWPSHLTYAEFVHDFGPAVIDWCRTRIDVDQAIHQIYGLLHEGKAVATVRREIGMESAPPAPPPPPGGGLLHACDFLNMPGHAFFLRFPSFADIVAALRANDERGYRDAHLLAVEADPYSEFDLYEDIPRLRRLVTAMMEFHQRPWIWLLPETPAVIARYSLDQWIARMRKLVAGVDDLDVRHCAGLETPEYWTDAQVARWVRAIREVTQRPIAVHGTPGHVFSREVYDAGATHHFHQFVCEPRGGGFLATEAQVRAETQAHAYRLRTWGVEFVAFEYAHRQSEVEAKLRGDVALVYGSYGFGNGGPVPPEDRHVPPQPPANGVDAFDLSRVQSWLRGPNVADWTLTSVLPSATCDGREWRFPHSTAGSWPTYLLNGDTPVEGNVWIVAHVGGRWCAATFDWMRVGQTSKTEPIENLGVDQIRQAPMGASWVPRKGDELYLFVSTPARDGQKTSRAERSNVVRLTWV